MLLSSSIRSSLAAFAAALALVACDGSSTAIPGGGAPPGELVRSSKPRSTASVPASDTQQLTRDNAAFALDVLRSGAKEGEDFFVSPHSMSIALAMTYAGANGQTATQMSHALRFTLPPDRLHSAFGALDLALADRAKKVVESGQPFKLDVVNAIWSQRGFEIVPAYLDRLAVDYGAGVSLLDFARDPEGARQSINGWVSQRTETRIPELLAKGTVTSATVLVLTNAVYFNASWDEKFDPADTKDGPFTLLDSTTKNVALMHQSKEHRYAEGDGWQALELSYVGRDVSMLLVLPAPGAWSRFREGFDGARLESIVGALGTKLVDVTLPKFSFRTQLGMKVLLRSLGMTDAFDAGVADFSGIDGKRDLFVQDVVHEAFVAVDERGTEAAAATAVIIGRVSIPEHATFEANRPFFVFLRDEPTGAVLFAGQVTAP